jgi:hypothetical protein
MPRVKKTLDEYFKSSKIELGQHLNGTYVLYVFLCARVRVFVSAGVLIVSICSCLFFCVCVRVCLCVTAVRTCVYV